MKVPHLALLTPRYSLIKWQPVATHSVFFFRNGEPSPSHSVCNKHCN
jgi:hypothetical protein